MTQNSEDFCEHSRAPRMQARAAGAELLQKRWFSICEKYLRHKPSESNWRFNRETRREEPSQGWKLHVSATVLNACDIFEKIVPLLLSQDVQFKAPNSLAELYKINSGLHYGYWQVGKFVTIYPATEGIATILGSQLHELTGDFIAPSIPFDQQYLPNSCVFYRYGAFKQIEMKSSSGEILPAVKNPSGKLVYDDRFEPVPAWLSDPFQKYQEITEKTADAKETETPLTETYRIFRAFTQRGKGGTYQAFDLSVEPPRFCVVKEGRRFGEVGWNGQDGYSLLKNEFVALTNLREICGAEIPRVYSSFEIEGNFYVAIECVVGNSLNDLMKTRRRRFSIKRTVELAIEISGVIDSIHQSGWVWNDCKPANLIVAPEGTLRPIDFEGAYPANEFASFKWKTEGFARPLNHQIDSACQGKADDIYSLGAVIYFLLTGRLYDFNSPTAIEKLRRNVPLRLREIVRELLSGSETKKNISALEAKEEFERILSSIKF